MRRHALPIGLLRDLLSAFRQDVTTTRYARYDDLLDYCRRSANPVGRLLLALYRVRVAGELRGKRRDLHGPAAHQLLAGHRGRLGKGRVYVPQEDLERFGVTERNIAHGPVDARWRALLAFETARSARAARRRAAAGARAAVAPRARAVRR